MIERVVCPLCRIERPLTWMLPAGHCGVCQRNRDAAEAAALKGGLVIGVAVAFWIAVVTAILVRLMT